MIDYYKTKAHPISRKMVLEAYKKIRNNGKAAGVDGVSIEDFGQDLNGNLYKLWNRMTSGCYHPQQMREKKIAKSNGKTRSLNIPCVADRIAQSVVKTYLERKVEPTFHDDSYGYRPKRHAHQAINKATQRCFKHSWIIDMDIESFFDTIDHELMMKAVQRYTEEKWVLMYIERWLKSGVVKEDGKLSNREEGSGQGSVISPLLSNIFLHFVFDKWMEKNYPRVPFERYCDDIIVHCKSKAQALYMQFLISERLKACKLKLNQEKTRIVFCKNPNNKGMENHQHVSFNFLGYTFKPTLQPTKNGLLLLTTPSMSTQSKKRVREKIKELKIKQAPGKIHQLAKVINERTRGWINYYCEFGKWATVDLWRGLNWRLLKWAMNRRTWGMRRAVRWLKSIYETRPGLFIHWAIARP